jgi:hypothetical protein
MTKRRGWNRPEVIVERRAIPPDRREARKASRPSKSPDKPADKPKSPMVADLARQTKNSAYGFLADFWLPSKD